MFFITGTVINIQHLTITKLTILFPKGEVDNTYPISQCNSVCMITSLLYAASIASENYDPEGNFKLTPEDISILSEDLRNALIPFEHVKITGDLGEGMQE